MKYFPLAATLILIAACTSPVDPSRPAPPPLGPATSSGSLTIRGPFVHEHLALYVVEDPAAKPAGEMITLAEGLVSGQVKVSEKKSAEVSELLIENQSALPCFVQAGDVVKGGQQDRAIGRDFVIPPKTAPVPVSSFCVEQSRWAGTSAFASSTQNAYGGRTKLAVQRDSSQQKVWESVAKSKSELRAYTASPAMSSSLNEELEDPKIKEKLSAFRKALGDLLKERPQAIGLIFAINGKFSTADLYDDPSLFRKVYPRLLDSATMEALTVKAEEKAAPPTSEAAAFLAEAEKGETKTEEIRQGLNLQTCESKKSVQFDYAWQGRRLHRQVVLK